MEILTQSTDPPNRPGEQAALLNDLDPKTRAVFKLLFLVYQRQSELADRLEDTITGLEAAGVFLRQSHSKAVIQDYLTRQVEAERRKMQRRF